MPERFKAESGLLKVEFSPHRNQTITHMFFRLLTVEDAVIAHTEVKVFLEYDLNARLSELREKGLEASYKFMEQILRLRGIKESE